MSAAQLLPVTSTLWDMEYSVHECPRRHKEYVEAIFPGTPIDDMLVIPTCQHACLDLVQRGEKVEEEKDRLLERFMAFAAPVCQKLIQAGHWADYIDPCSGLPMIHRDTGSVYGEVEALITLLGYKSQNAGCCKVVLHPRWGSAVYPASLFAKAPLEAVQQAIRETEEELRGKGLDKL